MLIGWLTAVLILALVGVVWANRQRRARLLASVAEVTLPAVRSDFLDDERDVLVLLPPGYELSEERFAVLYVNDGQDAAALELRATLARLYERRQIRPLIAVAVPTGEARLQEYGTAVAPNAQGLGTQAAAYGRFMTEELMPLIDGQFRTRKEAAETAVLGASLGGLSAFDLAWNHRERFGLVGVFSGSFWWRAGAAETAVTPNRRIAHEMVRRGEYRPGFRAWFQAGTRDETADRDDNGVIDAIQDTLELIDELVALGYRREQEIVYVEVPGGRHNYHTWSRVLPQFLTWAFPR